MVEPKEKCRYPSLFQQKSKEEDFDEDFCK
jgi:hypothetical protein